MGNDFRKWLAVGTGVGVEVLDTELQVTIARVRPSGIAVLGSATVPDFRARPATEWGTDLNGFLKKLGCGHIAVTVLLPRKDVIVRQISLPGVTDNDLAAAIQLQIDSLHPFADDEAAYSFARIDKSPTILIGITRQEIIQRYTNLFADAGVKVASFTFSAAVLHSAMRLLTVPPADGFLAIHSSENDVEAYGESPARPIFSAELGALSEKAIAFSRSELRLPPDAEPYPVEQLLPKPSVFPPNHDPAGEGYAKIAFPYATALAGACPWLGLNVNLLPPDQRRGSSRLRLIPTIVLGVVLLLMAGALAAYSSYEDSKYLAVLHDEIRKVEPRARKVSTIDRQIIANRARTQMLDDFRRRSRADMDALNELTHLLPPPGWLNGLEIRRNQVQLSGETEQAATLLKVIDSSPLFENSEFTMAPTRTGNSEVFSIRAHREGTPK